MLTFWIKLVHSSALWTVCFCRTMHMQRIGIARYMPGFGVCLLQGHKEMFHFQQQQKHISIAGASFRCVVSELTRCGSSAAGSVCRSIIRLSLATVICTAGDAISGTSQCDIMTVSGRCMLQVRRYSSSSSCRQPLASSCFCLASAS